ncbi:hypothetical protein LCGC14_1128250 [marine sediment metagenome]|uniref:Thioredoxin domain-containing protein n=1 Tax=marine sediment metagenome TaxID=412755 RepID=A0A0F9M6N6_9ZZZZ
MKNGLRIMSLFVAAAAVLFLVPALSPGEEAQKTKEEPKTETIEWMSYDKTLNDARESQTPILIDFYTKMNCPRCYAMEKKLYTNAKVIKEINAKVFPVRILLEKMTPSEKKLAQKFKYGNECLMVIVSADMKVLFRDNQIVSADKLLKALQEL